MRTGFFAAAGLGLVISQLWGGEDKERLKSRGKVAGVDARTRSLVVEAEPAGKVQTFEWDEATAFLDIDGAIEPAKLRVGQRVLVCGSKKAATVSRVEVEPVYDGQSQTG